MSQIGCFDRPRAQSFQLLFQRLQRQGGRGRYLIRSSMGISKCYPAVRPNEAGHNSSHIS